MDADRVRRNITESLVTITELADTLVRREGVSFRTAHAVAGAVAQAALVAGITPQAGGYLAFREAFAEAVGRPTGLDETAYNTALSPENFVAVRGNFGGPAAASMTAACERYAASIAALEAGAAADAARLGTASAMLEAATARLLAAP